MNVSVARLEPRGYGDAAPYQHAVCPMRPSPPTLASATLWLACTCDSCTAMFSAWLTAIASYLTCTSFKKASRGSLPAEERKGSEAGVERERARERARERERERERDAARHKGEEQQRVGAQNSHDQRVGTTISSVEHVSRSARKEQCVHPPVNHPLEPSAPTEASQHYTTELGPQLNPLPRYEPQAFGAVYYIDGAACAGCGLRGGGGGGGQSVYVLQSDRRPPRRLLKLKPTSRRGLCIVRAHGRAREMASRKFTFANACAPQI